MCDVAQRLEDKGVKQTIYDLVQSGDISPEKGAEKLKISVEQLHSDMEASGYRFPN